MQQSRTCMACGEQGHVSSKCKQIGIPPDGFFTGGGGGGGHSHEDDEHCVFTSKPTVYTVGEDEQLVGVVAAVFAPSIVASASYYTALCSQDGESQRGLLEQSPSALDSPNRPSSVVV